MFILYSVVFLERFMLSCTLELEDIKRREKIQNGKVIMIWIKRIKFIMGCKTAIVPSAFKPITYICNTEYGSFFVIGTICCRMLCGRILLIFISIKNHSM
jgi:hypothetical protein